MAHSYALGRQEKQGQADGTGEGQPVSGRNRRGGGTVFWDEDRGCYTGQLSHYDAAGKTPTA